MGIGPGVRVNNLGKALRREIDDGSLEGKRCLESGEDRQVCLIGIQVVEGVLPKIVIPTLALWPTPPTGGRRRCDSLLISPSEMEHYEEMRYRVRIDRTPSGRRF